MTLVCFAVEQEARPFRSYALPNVKVIVTGMGRRASIRSLESAFSTIRPECVLTCGFAGGLNPSLPKYAVLYSAQELPSVEQRLASAGALAARFHCAERVLSFATEKAALRESTGADAVEMESGHIRDFCTKKGVPSATIRVLLDGASENLPVDFNEVMGPDARISPLKMAKTILLKPSVVSGLLRLNKESGIAANRLAEVLTHVL